MPVSDSNELLSNIEKALETDIYVFSGEIDVHSADALIKCVKETKQPRSNVALILTTYGGNPDAAYRMARFLKTKDTRFILYVFGFCKSAGTLIALAADEVVMSDYGELGPLDMQLSRTDDLVFSDSGLDIPAGLQAITGQAFNVFQTFLSNIINISRGRISTKTAAEIAKVVAVGLLSPVSAQIDPQRLGFHDRAIQVAQYYGERLTAGTQRSEAVSKLMEDYPSHGFVIDRTEAQDLLKNVRPPNHQEELKLELTLRRHLRFPRPEPLVDRINGSILSAILAIEDQDNEANSSGSDEEVASTDDGDGGESPPHQQDIHSA